MPGIVIEPAVVSMSKKLEDRVALVTGAGRGIGRAIAISLAGEGANVSLTARSRNELDEVVSDIAAAGGRDVKNIVILLQFVIVGQFGISILSY